MNQPWLNLQPPPPPGWHHLRQHNHLLFFLYRQQQQQQQQQSPTTLLTTNSSSSSSSSSSNRGGRVNHGVVGIGLRPSAKQTAASPTPSGISLSFEEEEEGSELHNVQSARERREMRKMKRSSTQSYNWREEVEERLLVKPKKRNGSWMEKLNFDSLAGLGPQWWVLRVTRQEETAARLVRAFTRNHPDLPFKVYNPAVKMKHKLKNGSVSVKPKPLLPGCIFLHCLLNKEIHNFVREIDGIGGFLGSPVGNGKRQIRRPKSVPADQIEEIFRQAREEQEIADREFEEKYPSKESCDGDSQPDSAKHAKSKERGTVTKRRTTKASVSSDDNPLAIQLNESLATGSAVRVLSGPFMDFTGSLKVLNHKTGKATVVFTLFGKKSVAELDVDQIVADIASP